MNEPTKENPKTSKRSKRRPAMEPLGWDEIVSQPGMGGYLSFLNGPVPLPHLQGSATGLDTEPGVVPPSGSDPETAKRSQPEIASDPVVAPRPRLDLAPEPISIPRPIPDLELHNAPTPDAISYPAVVSTPGSTSIPATLRTPGVVSTPPLVATPAISHSFSTQTPEVVSIPAVPEGLKRPQGFEWRRNARWLELPQAEESKQLQEFGASLELMWTQESKQPQGMK